jgi:fatty-acyl-CoA synthase
MSRFFFVSLWHIERAEKEAGSVYCGNMGRWISWWSRVHPRKDAVVFQETRVSYGELNERVNRLADALRGNFGVGKGDRVGCLLTNCIEYYELALASAKIGARFVPFNVRLTDREVAYIAGDSTPKVIVTEALFLPVLETVRSESPGIRLINLDEGEYEALVDSGRSEEPPDQAGWEDDFAILYTSGTTGFPKGAVLTQLSILSVTHNMIAAFGHDHRDRFLMQLPLCFTGALITMSMPLFHAGGTILMERDFIPARTLELIESEGITLSSGVPTQWKLVSDEPGFGNADFKSMRLILCGGAPVPMTLYEVYRQKGVPFTAGYGLTEGGGFNLYLPPDRAGEKSGGYIPLLWNDVRAVNASGEVVLPGEIGEIALRGPVIMREYWNNPEATAESIKDEWLYTGDLARVDDEGYYFIVDRAKDMIVSGGLNTYPAEIENVIYSYAGVSQAAVIGVPHEVWGEMVVAVVVPKPGEKIEEEGLKAFCRENLADYKCPKSVIFAESLPMNTAGKVLKRVLREEYAGRVEHFSIAD